MRPWAILTHLALALSSILPISANAGSPGELAMGMSEHAVVRVMGPPDAVRLERNGVLCLTYQLHQHRLWSRLFGTRTILVALKDNGFVDYETVRTEAIRSHCSRIAGRWDPPMRQPLICEDRWSPRCCAEFGSCP